MAASIFRRIGWVAVLLAAVVPGWAQDQPPVQPPPDAPATGDAPAPAAAEVPAAAATGPVDSEDLMLAPPPVSGEDFPVVFATEARSNYLRGGITFTSAYSDNVVAETGANPVSDVSYSVWPVVALEETTGRSKVSLSYAPGFTFYQKSSGRDEMDQNLAADYQYRLSPHVTLHLRDSFQKTSDAFNSPGQGLATGVSGSLQGGNNLVIAPIADRITNLATGGLSYQFSANGMIGANVFFNNLHYPNPSQLLGELFDSSAQSASVFHTLRLSRQHYLGITYQYQRLLAYPTGGLTETQTNGVLAFYSWAPSARISLSGFGGPQYSSTAQPGQPNSHLLAPAAGGSASWQGQRTVMAVSFSHVISGGGGLVGASRSDSAGGAVRQLLSRYMNASLSGSYVDNQIIAVANLPDNSGHSLLASAALERQLGPNLSLQAGYTRLRQIYQDIPAISQHPNTNREWLTVSYLFSRPLGR